MRVRDVLVLIVWFIGCVAGLVLIVLGLFDLNSGLSTTRQLGAMYAGNYIRPALTACVIGGILSALCYWRFYVRLSKRWRRSY